MLIRHSNYSAILPKYTLTDCFFGDLAHWDCSFSFFILSASEISSLRDQLEKKDEQMKEMEDRYKNYLDKAKSVIKTLDPKQTEAENQEVILIVC